MSCQQKRCWASRAFDVHHHITVSSSVDGGKTPARLYGLQLVRHARGLPVGSNTSLSDVIYAPLDDVLLDTGSSITLLGSRVADLWIRDGFARTVKPRASSTRAIRGIGALNHVQRWVSVTIDVGGALVTFADVPVIKEHEGFLVGNDFLGKGRADVRYTSDSTGTLMLWDAGHRQCISSPVGFRTVPVESALSAFVRTRTRRRLKRRVRRERQPRRQAHDTVCESEYESEDETTASESCIAVDFGEVSAEERAERYKEVELAHEIESAIQDVMPVGWVPETTEIPAWSEAYFKIRVPATLAGAREILLMPLEDERQADLGVLIAPTLQRVSKEGYVMCRAINMQKHKVRIPLCTPCVRFQVDPRVYNVQHEFTVEEIIAKISIDDSLTVEERAAVAKLIATRRALFSSTLGYTHVQKMAIKVKPGAKPPNATLRLRTPEERAALKKEVDKQLKAGLIEPCRSPYGAMPMLIKKPTKEGEPQAYRIVLDYRGCNAILDGVDAYRLPNMSTNLSSLGKANWYTCMDLLQGFHQVELADDGVTKEVTAFNTEDGQFQYTRMPMGLASSPSTFMRIVDATLRGLPPGIALAYADDICIPTHGTFEQHMKDVGKVMDRLIEAGFRVRCDKCHVGLKQVPYLGFMVGAYGTRPLPEKTQAIFDINVNGMIGNPAAASRYAGMMGFYSKFIPNAQTLLGPFNDLKAKAAPVVKILGDVNNVPSLRLLAAFAATRHALATITALSRPDMSQPFYIYVDAASSCGVGAVLMQREDPSDPDSLRPIEFWSRRFIDEEKGYGVRDQECLGLYESLKQWRHYVSGSEIHLMSDHSSLQWLLSTSHPDGSRVAGWALYTQAFNVQIHYIEGRLNIVADFLSRNAKDTTPAMEQGPTGRRESITDRVAEVSSVSGVGCKQGESVELSRAESVDEDALSEAGTDYEGVQPRVSTTEVRQATRTALVVLRQSDQGAVEVLVETGMDAVAFPAAMTDVSAARFRYRDQLAAALRMEFSAQTQSLIKTALAFKRRRGLSDCQYFVAIAPPDANVHSTSTRTAVFRPLDERLAAELSDGNDEAFARLIARDLCITGVETKHTRNKWAGQMCKVAQRLHAVSFLPCLESIRTRALHNIAQANAASEESLPTIQCAPCGPAFISNKEDGDLAIQRINRRLRDNPGLSMALDLEGRLGGRRGHIECMQIAVDPVNDRQQQLIYVFDTETRGSQYLGTGLLREILEDGGVPKIVHCSYGDASALFNEYRIELRGSFDTGVADCIIRQTGLNRQRRLDKVISDHVDGAVLQYKGEMEFVPGMFAVRPMPRRLFEYAYEDVIHCNQLYTAMMAVIRGRNMVELTLALSAMRAPPFALKEEHALYVHPRYISVVVRDAEKMICLQNTATGTVLIPTDEYNKSATDKRWQAQQVWALHMGEYMTGAIANRMRKAVRVGDTLVVEAHVPDCTKFLAGLQSAQELLRCSRGDLVAVVRRVDSPDVSQREASPPEQAVVFQYMRWHTIEASVNVVLGRTLEKTRVAVVVYDETHVFCLTTATKGVLQFPSCPLEVGAEPRYIAEKAFDLFAGVALRKQGDGMLLLPVTSKAVRASFANMTELVTAGNTTYFGCYMPNLNVYRSAFYASRNGLNGFRLTPTLQKRHPGFTIGTWALTAPRLDPLNDIVVAHTLSAVIGDQLPPAVQVAAVSQHSGLAVEGEVCDDSEYREAHSGLDSELQPTAYDGPPPLGVDPEYDVLFEAAALLKYWALTETPAVVDAVNRCDVATASGNIGSPPQEKLPTAQEIGKVQEQHPATRGLVEYLRLGELSGDWGRLDDNDRAKFVSRAAVHFLDAEDVLRRTDDVNKQSNPEGLVVLPPCFRPFFINQFHNRAGHFGVEKTLGLLRRRFYWGSIEVMKRDIAEHIKRCHPCQVSKVPTHPAGEAQLGFCGNYPWEVLCGDVFYTGIVEDDYDHTLDFACFFSRQIRSEPLQGFPDASRVCDVLLNTVVRNHGVPAEVRSDAGSNFIAAGVRALYERMGIDITVGTAYHHQLVALVERWHRTLLQLLKVHRSATDKHGWGSKWYRCVPLMELVYNNTVNPSTGYTPFFMNHFRHARLPCDSLRSGQPSLPKKIPEWVQERLDDLNVVYDAAAQSLRLKSISAKRRYDLRHETNLWFKPGDRVLLVKGSITDKRAITPKALIPMDGPFTIAKALSNDRYLLSDLRSRRIRDVVHVSRLIPYYAEVACDDSTWMVNAPPSGGKWPVLDVVGRRVRILKRAAGDLGLSAGAAVTEYRIRWVGFDKDSDTWRPVQTLADIVELVKAYDARNPPSAEQAEKLEILENVEFQPRAAQERVEADDAARTRKHMRSLPHKGERRPPIDASAPPAELQEELAVEEVNDPVAVHDAGDVKTESASEQRERRRRERAMQKDKRQRGT